MPLGGGKFILFNKRGLSSTIRSLSYTRASSQSLEMTQANWGTPDSRTFAISLWYKRSSIGTGADAAHHIFQFGASLIVLAFTTDNFIDFSTGGANQLTTSGTFTDTTTYHHLYASINTEVATSGDRMRLYHDGTEITAFGTELQPTLNEDIAFGTGAVVQVSDNVNKFFDGLMYDLAFFDGVVPDVADLYNGGVPPNLTAFPGLLSHLNLNAGTTVEDDGVLATNWTNNNTVVASVTIP